MSSPTTQETFVSTPQSTSDASPAILQIVPNLVSGGVERGCIEIVEAIVAAGGKAFVASNGGPMVREVIRYGGEHIEIPIHRKHPWHIYKNRKTLSDVIDKYGIHLVHARSRAPAWAAYYACREKKIPFVTTFHAPYNFTNFLKRYYNSIMARGDRVIAISQYVANYILANYRIHETHMRLIPRGANLAHFSPEQVSAERIIQLMEKWTLPEDKPIILMPARLTPWKGHRVLIKALSLLDDIPYRCLLVGGSNEKSSAYRLELERLIAKLNLQEKIQFTGHCQDMPAAYKLSDVVIHASTEPEGFGRTIIEAQAMGRPVIASNIGAPPEVIQNGVTGWLMPPKDPAALAQALRLALSLDESQRLKLAQEAMSHIAKNYALQKMTQATLGVYNELLR